MQTLNVTVKIPEDYVLVEKIELMELQQNQLKGVYWTMQDLEKQINKKQDWIKENILFVQKFKLELDSNNNGCVVYPTKKGQPWVFHAQKMKKFLDENFSKIFAA